MRASMAYLAGAGTIVVAIAAGLGGGLTIANIVNPHRETREISKLEQRMAAKPVPQSAEADQAKAQVNNTQADKASDQPKTPVPYLAATQSAASAPVVVTPAPQNQAQTQQTQAAAPVPQVSPSPVVEQAKADSAPAQPAEPQTATPQAAPREASSSPDDANARARDSDLKRLAAEKRKADRRQQWADRKKALLARDAELRDVDASASRDADGVRVMRRDTDDGPRIVRRDTDGPRIVAQDDDDSGRRGDSDRRGDFGRRDRGNSDRPFGLPIFNLFGGGDRD